MANETAPIGVRVLRQMDKVTRVGLRVGASVR
jgi:hypothetical protein